MLAKGDLFHNYRVEKLLQRAGMVSTYEVVHEKDHRRYVLKVLEDGFQKVPNIQKSFVGEYMLASKIQHDHLVFVEQVFQKESAILLEHLDGLTLQEQLRISPKIEPLQALKWAAQILSALNVLHQNRMVHLEVNTSNIFLVPGANGSQKAILMDHGIGHRVKGGAVQPAFPSHSKFYLSPELISNPLSTKFRSDIYSLGVVMFEMMSGQKMVVGESDYAIQNAIVNGERKALKEAAPHVPTSIALVIEQALQLNPVSRYPTANAFMDALVRAVGGPLLEDDQQDHEATEFDDLMNELEEERQQEEAQNDEASSTDDSAEAEGATGSGKANQKSKSSSQKSQTDKGSDKSSESTTTEGIRSEENEEIEFDGTEQVDVEVLDQEVKYDIDGNIITLEHSAQEWTEAKMISPERSGWSIQITSKRILVPLVLLLLGLFVGGYKAQNRTLYIKIKGKPEWGETSLIWNGENKKLLDFSDVAAGKHSLVIEGGLYEKESCTRCCWSRSFDISVSMGFEKERREISLEDEQGFPRCPTLEANYIFSSIVAGHFDMGSGVDEPDRSDDELLHRVVISQPFLMGQTEVTQRLYKMVMNENPARFKDKDRPIESVSWFDAISFCNELSLLEGLSQCYQIEGGYVGWKAGLACDGYRLPTEAEWEYAARAGVDSFYSGGDDISKVWYGKTAGGQTQAVAKKPSNVWRLFDMSGNVSEWTWDYYGMYSVENFRDPKGPNEGLYRVLRGGDWMHIPSFARVNTRQESAPARRSPYIGFRIVQSELTKDKSQ